MPTEGIGHAPSDTLVTRTYAGLLAAQFLAAFNDQAIHAAAMFFAINTHTLSEAQAISLMPILFYAPWAIFCTLAGYYADRYSKRNILVLWKVAEVGICALALFGFWFGTDGGHPQAGAWVVLSTVFLMGTHSAFFVPAKYGIMPEILQPHLLSRGNGMLESLSFLAVILGTISGGVMSFVFLRRETNIGIVLLGLAVIGALCSLLIRWLPAANTLRRFPAYLYGPLIQNLKTLLWIRPLAFAVIGIAFFTFILAFLRATVYMFGESQNPRWDELKTSVVVGTVALGVGIGSPLAGYVSGRKVELGLIPIGAAGMIVGCVLAGLSLSFIPGFIAGTILLGICTSFYLVPLFTLLQYRAPKSSKGDMIASSNFINVTGAIAASLLFAALVYVAKKTEFIEHVHETDNVAVGEFRERTLQKGHNVHIEVGDKSIGRKPTEGEPAVNLYDHLFGPKPSMTPPEIHIARTVQSGDAVIVSHYRVGDVDHYAVRPADSPLGAHYDARSLPRFLFLGAGLMTLGVLLVLWRRIPDLPKRAMNLLRSMSGKRYVLDGLANVPGDQPVILVIETNDAVVIRSVRSAIDRYVVTFEPMTVEEGLLETAGDILARGDVVAVLSSAPAAAAFATSLQGLHLRVHVDGHRLVFGDSAHRVPMIP